MNERMVVMFTWCFGIMCGGIFSLFVDPFVVVLLASGLYMLYKVLFP